jgi:hypothetical protein
MGLRSWRLNNMVWPSWQGFLWPLWCVHQIWPSQFLQMYNIVTKEIQERLPKMDTDMYYIHLQLQKLNTPVNMRFNAFSSSLHFLKLQFVVCSNFLQPGQNSASEICNLQSHLPLFASQICSVTQICKNKYATCHSLWWVLKVVLSNGIYNNLSNFHECLVVECNNVQVVYQCHKIYYCWKQKSTWLFFLFFGKWY